MSDSSARAHLRRASLAAVLAALAIARGTCAAELELEDPTRPYEAAPPRPEAVAEARYELSSVLISPTRRVAVINGRVYLEGQTVDGAEIVRIEERAVRLTRDGEVLLIRLVEIGRAAEGES